MKAKVFSILALLLVAATGAMAQTYNVTVKDGTEDADKWTISPNPATAGQTVTITYNGTKKVKSIKAVKKAPATLVESISLNYTAMTIVPEQTETLSIKTVTPDDATDQTVTWSSDNTDVATVNATTGEVTAVAAGTATITATANDGSGVTATCVVTVVVPDLVITGTSSATIPAGKTAVLNGVNISNGSINCAGDATIILMGDNTVTGAANNAAIQINLMDAYSENYTLTITGTGSITAQGGDNAAGIGSGNCRESGNIIITGGTIIATGGNNAAGIGSGYCADAKNITIANTVTKVTATKGSGAEHSIGGGAIGRMFNGCSVTINGTNYNGISTSPYTYEP